MSTVETRSRFNKMVVPGLFALMTEEYKRFPETWRQLVRTERSSQAYEESTYVTGYGVIPTKAEGAPITYDARIQGATKRWTHNTYAMGARISEEAIEDDLYGVMKSVARDIGVSARETRHIRVASIFNLGFGTTENTTGQGYAIFYGSHVKLGGGTWSNLATASALSYSTLQTGILAFEGQTDHRGKKINQTPMTILVPPALEFKALELLQTVGQPETANNDVNAVKLARPRLRLVVWPYLTSSTAWFLIGDNARTETGLIHFERVGVTFGREGDFDTGDVKFKTRWRDSVEINEPIGLYGNAGA
jgi:hypothetical protein